MTNVYSTTVIGNKDQFFEQGCRAMDEVFRRIWVVFVTLKSCCLTHYKIKKHIAQKKNDVFSRQPKKPCSVGLWCYSTGQFDRKSCFLNLCFSDFESSFVGFLFGMNIVRNHQANHKLNLKMEKKNDNIRL